MLNRRLFLIKQGMFMKQNLTEKDLSLILNISTRTLQDWRQRGYGPTYLKLGKSVRYSQVEVNNFISNALQSSTSATQQV